MLEISHWLHVNIVIKILEYGYTCKFFWKNNRYIKHEESHYLLAVIYNSMIKLPYYFWKKTAFDIFTSQIFHVIYKSMIKLPYFVKKLPLIYFYLSNISSSHLGVLEAFQVPPLFGVENFQASPPQIIHPPPPHSRNLWTLPNCETRISFVFYVFMRSLLCLALCHCYIFAADQDRQALGREGKCPPS